MKQTQKLNQTQATTLTPQDVLPTEARVGSPGTLQTQSPPVHRVEPRVEPPVNSQPVISAVREAPPSKAPPPITSTDTQSSNVQTSGGLPGGSPPMPTKPPQRLEVLKVLPWADPITDPNGYDPRSVYVELFWLPVLGPSSIWLMRRLSLWMDTNPNGFELNATEISQELGIAGVSQRKGPPLKRVITRCCDFGLMHPGTDNYLYVRKYLPPVNPRLLTRFGERLRQAYLQFTTEENKSSVDGARNGAPNGFSNAMVNGEMGRVRCQDSALTRIYLSIPGPPTSTPTH